MKIHALILLVFSMSAGAVTYYPNDGTSPPGSFTEKQEESQPAETKTFSKKVIKKTVKEKQEVREVPKDRPKDKPVLDSNPNDETYKIGPLNTPNSSEEE